MKSKQRVVAALGAGLLLLSACGSSDGSDDTDAGEESSGAASVVVKSELDLDSTPATTAVPANTTEVAAGAEQAGGSDSANKLCVGTRVGLSCVSDGTWVSYTSENSPIYEWVGTLAICPDGTVIVPTIGGLALLKDERWSEIEIDFVSGAVDAVACTNTGQIWVGGFKSLGFFDSGAWTTFDPEAVLGTSEFISSVDSIKAAPDGSVWVLTPNSVSTYSNGNWTVWEEGAGIEGSFFPGSIAIDDLGGGQFDAYVSDGFDGIGKLTDGEWVFQDLSLIGDNAMAVQGGAVFISSFQEGVLQLVDGISTAITPEYGLSSDTVKAIEIDRSGRQWVGTNYGLTLLSEADTRVIRVDNSGLIDNDIYAIATIGDGPVLPAEQAKVPGSITGQILGPDGSALGGIAVEICVEDLRDEFDGETPCSDHPYAVTGTTDAEGHFELSGVRPGRYVVAMQPPSGWTYLINDFSSAARFAVPEGDTFDVGPIALSPKDE